MEELLCMNVGSFLKDTLFLVILTWRTARLFLRMRCVPRSSRARTFKEQGGVVHVCDLDAREGDS